MKKRIISLLLIAVFIVGSFTTVVFGASKKKKMTVYDQVCKVGNTAYCCTGQGLYKYDLNNGSKVLLHQVNAREVEAVSRMKVYKGYLYFFEDGEEEAHLYRVRMSNNKVKRLVSCIHEYAISKKKIYYVRAYSEKPEKRVMKLNGKGKKKSHYNVVNKCKASNAKGYYIHTKLIKKIWQLNEDRTYYDWAYIYADYLIAPGKQVLLCTYYADEDYD